MLQPELFDNLPEDLKTRLIYNFGGYSVAKKHYNEMTQYRELDCKRPISAKEVKINLMKDHSLLFLFPEIIGQYTLLRLPTGTDELLSVYINHISETIDTVITIKGLILGHNILTNVASLPASAFGDVSVKVIDDTFVNYDDILLVPSSVVKILSNRGELCRNHINKSLIRYIQDTYYKLYDSKDMLLMWLVFVASLTNIDWKYDKYSYAPFASEIMIGLSFEQQNELIDELYGKILDLYI